MKELAFLLTGPLHTHGALTPSLLTGMVGGHHSIARSKPVCSGYSIKQNIFYNNSNEWN
jgi:hypothetical protein